MGNFVSAPPNEAVLITGLFGTRVRVGQTGWKWNYIEKHEIMSLQLIQLEINSAHSETVRGVPLAISSVATVKVKSKVMRQHISSLTEPLIRREHTPAVMHQFAKHEHVKLDKESILLAAQQFGGRTTEEIKSTLQSCLEGHQREILGTLTVEQVFKDRASFSAKVREHVTGDLSKMGFEVISYSIKTISDVNGYMQSLGATQTALVKREAAEGEAKNRSEARQKISIVESTARIAVAKTVSEAHVSTNQQLELQVEADEALELKRAGALLKVGVANEQAQAAINLVREYEQQQVVREKIIQKLVAAEEETLVAHEEARKTRAELEGQSMARLKMSENDAKSTVISSHAQAESIRLLAQAEADALLFKGKATAQGLKLKAEAYNMQNQAALSQAMIEVMPAVAAEVAKPLSKTDKITFVSNGGADGSGGPSALTRDITNIVSQLPHSVQALTGFDLRQAINNSSKPVEKRVVVAQEALL